MHILTMKIFAQKRSQSPPPSASLPNRLKITAIATVLMAGLGLCQSAGLNAVHANKLPNAANSGGSPTASNGFAPTVENKNTPKGSAPVGMSWIPGGEFLDGGPGSPTMDAVGMQATVDSRPIHRVYVDGFWMDKTDVTNAEFARFVKAMAM